MDNQLVEICYNFLIFSEYLILLFFKLGFLLFIFAEKIKTRCPKTYNKK
jgi:hypothetical protein